MNIFCPDVNEVLRGRDYIHLMYTTGLQLQKDREKEKETKIATMIISKISEKCIVTFS
jgi:hypothetical protein